MYLFLFTALAFACAGCLCALLGDLQNRVYVGLASFLAVNALIWGKFIVALFSSDDLLTSASLFLLSHFVTALAYLGTVYFLDARNMHSPAGTLVVHRD